MAHEAAWLTADKQALAAVLLQSHQRAFSRPLIASAQPGQSKRLHCQTCSPAAVRCWHTERSKTLN